MRWIAVGFTHWTVLLTAGGCGWRVLWLAHGVGVFAVEERMVSRLCIPNVQLRLALVFGHFSALPTMHSSFSSAIERELPVLPLPFSIQLTISVWIIYSILFGTAWP